MKFDYPYLGTQLLITAVGHSITQQPLQMSTVAANMALGWNSAPPSRGTSLKCQLTVCVVETGLARDDLVLL